MLAQANLAVSNCGPVRQSGLSTTINQNADRLKFITSQDRKSDRHFLYTGQKEASSLSAERPLVHRDK